MPIVPPANSPELTSGFDEAYWLDSRWHHEADDEKLAERINNDLQNMWRSGTAAGLTPNHPAMAFIDRMLQEWLTFYDDFRDSLFARAFDPFDLWTEYHDDLLGWARRMTALVQRLPALVPDRSQRQEVEHQLEQRGVPERAEEYARAAGATGLSPRTRRLLLGFAAAGAMITTGVWIATKRRRRR